MTTLQHPEGRVLISQLPQGRNKVEVQLRDPAIFSPLLTCETTYATELISTVLDAKGPAWLCDEIARDEDRDYVLKHLENDMRAYFRFEDVAGKRILDFGCGSGASTMWLARLFPESEIVGIELERDLLRVAEARREHYRFDNVRLLQSPGGTELPDSIGHFDLIVLSAVYEHLLPGERTVILPQLWSLLNDRGILFLNQTPHRYFPLELHTTSLPLINYLPDNLTLKAARRFSRRVDENDTWERLLRAGIRGATVSEIKGNLRHDRSNAVLLPPTITGLRDRVDLWFLTTNPENLKVLKQVARMVLKAINSLTGIAVVPELTLAFQKQSARK